MMRTPMTCSINVLTIRNLNAYDHIISNGPRIQCVRWKRKPIWLPTAKSKVFRVPVRPVIPDEDYRELLRLYHNYKTLMKSVSNFFIEQDKERSQLLDENVVKINSDKDFEICSYMNDIWNKQVATIREQRLAKEREYRKQEIATKLEAKKERDSKIQQIVDAEIKKVKEEATTFITPEHIDTAIQNALENIIDHNAAIDIHGKFYKDKPENELSSELSNVIK